MRLTNTIRHAFVRAVMDDTPEADHYGKLVETVIKAYADRLPPAVKPLWDDPKLRCYLRTMGVYVDGVHISGVPADPSPIKPSENWKDLAKQVHLANQDRLRLKNELLSVVNSASTSEGLAKLLPEFAKYLPKDPPKTKNLPAVTNVVTDFVKAGWPKGQPVA